VTLEISTRLGDTLLDVTYVDAGGYSLADQVLVHDGVLVAAPSGCVGLVDYEVREVVRPTRNLPYTRAADHQVVPYVAAALLLHVGIWALAIKTKPVVEPTVEATPRPRLVARIAASPSAATVPNDRATDRQGTKSRGEGQAANGPAGLAGTKSVKQKGHIAVQNTGEVAQLSKADAVARARRAGILGHTQVLEQTIANMAGAEKLTSAFDNMTVNAAIGGAGDAAGTFGMATTGSGGGGGGSGWGTIGTGRYGTFSNGDSLGHGWGGSIAPQRASWDRNWDGRTYSYYPVRHKLGRYLTILTICPTGTTCTVEGSLDKAIVRRYVKRQTQKLQYCFEKELLRNPELAGDVQVLFEARGDGTIGDVVTTGFDTNVAACVQGVFYALTLPSGTALATMTLRFRPIQQKLSD
jgi:hypothetical protein